MKRALKLPQLNRSWLMLAGAIALGLVATGLSHKAFKDHMAQIDAAARGAHRMVAVVVAKQDLPRGAHIEPRYFARREMPAEYVHATAVDPRHFGQYVGQRLGAALKRG